MINNASTLIIGLMSGTSLDGLDIAACRFWQENELWKFEIVKAETIAYSEQEKNELKQAFNLSGVQLIALHHKFGNEIGKKVKQFCSAYQLVPDYIASHGHTIFHQPHNGFTFQLGHGANIAAQSGIKTICDFRTSDVAYGGQGAPLVPIGDELLFAQFDCCLNLGGISNISFLENGIRKAFDIGICNMALNQLVQQIKLEYDRDGLRAQAGIINEPLLLLLKESIEKNQLKFQSLGFEWYQQFIEPIIKKSTCSINDKLRTCCELISTQIAQVLNNKKHVLVTGGGAKNKFLIHCIQSKTNCKLILPEIQIIDFKEALIFAFLGILRVHEQINCLSLNTGASKNVTGGAVYLP